VRLLNGLVDAVAATLQSCERGLVRPLGRWLRGSRSRRRMAVEAAAMEALLVSLLRAEVRRESGPERAGAGPAPVSEILAGPCGSAEVGRLATSLLAARRPDAAAESGVS
jgi:hypothetical protein